MKYYKFLIFILLIFYSLIMVNFYFNNKRIYANKIPVITFHRLVPDNIKNTLFKDNQWVGSIDKFKEMMEYLDNNGFYTLSSKEFVDWYNGTIDLPKKSILITFDDGFYEDYYLAYPILKQYNFKAVSFIVGSRINDTTDQYDESSKKQHFIGQDVIDKTRLEYPNWEFQSHSYDLHKYSNGKHQIEVSSNYEIYEDILKTKKFGFNVFAYPFGDYNDYIMKALAENNYDIAFGFGLKDYARRSDLRYNIRRIKINGNANLAYLKNWLKYL